VKRKVGSVSVLKITHIKEESNWNKFLFFCFTFKIAAVSFSSDWQTF
jgi:hypothetical protein